MIPTSVKYNEGNDRKYFTNDQMEECVKKNKENLNEKTNDLDEAVEYFTE